MNSTGINSEQFPFTIIAAKSKRKRSFLKEIIKGEVKWIMCNRTKEADGHKANNTLKISLVILIERLNCVLLQLGQSIVSNI